jgi:hypothetical protein
MQMSDRDILRLYTQWSEKMFAAGPYTSFTEPTEQAVAAFHNWMRYLRDADAPPLEAYQREMLLAFHQQEARERLEGRD